MNNFTSFYFSYHFRVTFFFGYFGFYSYLMIQNNSFNLARLFLKTDGLLFKVVYYVLIE